MDDRRRFGGSVSVPCRRRWVVVAASAVALMAVSACTSSGGGTESSPVAGNPIGVVTTSTVPAVPTAVISSEPSARQPLNPVTPIQVSVSDGRLTSVKLVNPDGKRVAGAMSADGLSWRSTEVLGYSRTYTLSAVAVNAEGVPTEQTMKYTTITPDNLTMPYINHVGGGGLENGATYGVGLVPVVHFDEPITDKAAAEQRLKVRTTPHVKGVWNWVSDQDVHWRPREFFAAGTKVTVSANVYGVRVGPGLYGQSDVRVSFRIGQKRVAIADDTTHTVKVYFGGKLQREMPVSMGQGGWVPGSGSQISLWTMSGTYTVIGHENPAIMSSESYGLPASSPYGYGPEPIYWATKISTDGIYLHSAPWSVWAQGSQNVSHGCLNLSPDNATWYFETTRIGDVVKVLHTTGPEIEIWQGGDWSVPWSEWVKGSALR